MFYSLYHCFSFLPLNCIHKGALYTAEQNQANEKKDKRDNPTDEIIRYVKIAEPKHRVSERGDDRRDRIEHIQASMLHGDQIKSISDRGRVLPQLQAEAHQHRQIPVFCGNGRDDDAAANGKEQQLKKQQRQEQKRKSKMNAGAAFEEVYQHDNKKHGELNGERNEPRTGCGDRRDKPGIIDLPHDGTVIEECFGGRVQGAGEKSPADVARHIEQEPWHAVIPGYIGSGQLRQISEDDGKNHGGQQRLNDGP